jgi:hypothetical protein
MQPTKVSASQIETQYNLPKGNLSHWHKNGSLALGGRKLRAERTQTQGRPSLYDQVDIEHIVALPVSDGRLADKEGTWLAAGLASRLFGYSLTSLDRWRREHCPLLARRIRARKQVVRLVTRRGSKFDEIFFYFEDDLREIAAVQAAGKATAQDTGRWLTCLEAKAQYGYGEWALWQWSDHGCPRLGGRKLRFDYQVFRRGKYVRRMRVFLKDDLEAIAQAAAPRSPTSAKRGDEVTAQEAEEQFGYSDSTLMLWHKQGCIYLSGRKFSARKVRMELGNHTGEVWLFLRAQLEEIARQQAVLPDSPHEDQEGIWLPAIAVEKLHGLRAHLLQDWSERACWVIGGRKLDRKKIWRPSKMNSRGWVWGYHQRDILEIVARFNDRSPSSENQQPPVASPATIPPVACALVAETPAPQEQARTQPKSTVADPVLEQSATTRESSGAWMFPGEVADPGLEESVATLDGEQRTAETAALSAMKFESAVVLRGPDETVLVLGRERPRLTGTTFDVVKALLDAGETGLSKDDLDKQSGHTEARKYLKTLARNDPEYWGEVIDFPGKSWGRYKIRTRIAL